MNKQKRIASYILIGIIIVDLTLAFYFQNVISGQDTNYQTQHSEYQPFYSIFIEILIAPFVYLWRGMIHHPEVVTAIATVAIGWYTYALVQATKELTRLATQQENAIKTVERAYVKMSPGLLGFLGSSDEDIMGELAVNVEIKNCGETPAQITDVVCKFQILQKGESLPREPDYKLTGPHEPPTAFLVKNDYFFTLHTELAAVLKTNIRQIKDESVILIFFGCVDYTDQFDNWHRAGFARRYEPALDNESEWPSKEEFAKRSNFVFVLQPSYNYDRQGKNSNDGVNA